jgi:hypothetical protein
MAAKKKAPAAKKKAPKAADRAMQKVGIGAINAKAKAPLKKKAPKFIGAKKQASARGNLARKGLAVRDVAARNVQRRIGGTEKRQKSQSRGTAVSKGATNSAADRKLNQQARIKNEVGRGNMAMVKKDGNIRKSAGQVRKIQGAQRKVENATKATLARHSRGIERATKRGDAAGVAKHTAARRAVVQAYKGFVKGGRQVQVSG